MSQQGTPEASEAEIAVHWQEEGNVNPPEKFVVQANLTDQKVLERFSLDNFPDCFKEYADLLDWYRTWDVTLDTSNPPFWRWFVGGRINASYNCVDRHLAKYKNKTAIHFVPEPEQGAANSTAPCLPRSRRKVYFGTWREVAVYGLDELSPGQTLQGPAIIEAETTTVVINEGDALSVNTLGWLDIRVAKPGTAA